MTKIEQLEALIEKYRVMVAVEKQGDLIPMACNGTKHCVLVNVVYELEEVLRDLKTKEPVTDE
jgi:hypothetical protein